LWKIKAKFLKINNESNGTGSLLFLAVLADHQYCWFKYIKQKEIAHPQCFETGVGT